MAQGTRAGDSNQITRDYMDSLLIEFRHIDGVLPNTALTLFGETFATPIMTAALSHLHNHYPNGMVEMAKGAKAANAVMWAGMGEDAELEAITATGARTVKIIKPHADNAVVFHKIAHAERCGCFAVGMDVDHSFTRKGQYDNVLGLPMKPKSLEEIKSFVKATKLPFFIKGVLSVQDALKCLDAGVAGILVSHHHGIQDFAVPPLMILPEIAKAVAGRIPIFVDCGLATGMDAFKALALGATAVCFGRSLMEPLTAGGAEPVRARIEAATAELAGAMAFTGSPDLKGIDPTVIRAR